jgi:hypothetical protein
MGGGRQAVDIGPAGNRITESNPLPVSDQETCTRSLIVVKLERAAAGKAIQREIDHRRDEQGNHL